MNYKYLKSIFHKFFDVALLKIKYLMTLLYRTYFSMRGGTGEGTELFSGRARAPPLPSLGGVPDDRI
jgi:hypothetical protein